MSVPQECPTRVSHKCVPQEWAQYFVRVRLDVRRVDAERFVAGAGHCEVVSCGRGECRCHSATGV